MSRKAAILPAEFEVLESSAPSSSTSALFRSAFGCYVFSTTLVVLCTTLLAALLLALTFNLGVEHGWNPGEKHVAFFGFQLLEVDRTMSMEAAGIYSKHSQFDGIRTGMLYALYFVVTLHVKVAWRTRLILTASASAVICLANELMPPYNILQDDLTAARGSDHNLVMTIIIIVILAAATLETYWGGRCGLWCNRRQHLETGAAGACQGVDAEGKGLAHSTGHRPLPIS